MRNIKRAIALIMICALTAGLLAGCSSDQSMKKIQEKGTFVVGLDANFAPMGFTDENGEIVGFDIDLAREAASRMGVELELQPIDWDSKELELQSGKIDAIWNGLTITPAREKVMLFTKPYLDNRQIIITLAGSPIATKADLEGKVVGVQKGSTAVDALENDEISSKVKEVVQYPDNVAALQDLEIGRIEAVVCDEIVGKYHVAQKEGTFKVLEDVLATEQFGVGLRKGDVALRNKLQEVLDAMGEDGTAAAISEKWFGEDLFLKH